LSLRLCTTAAEILESIYHTYLLNRGDKLHIEWLPVFSSVAIQFSCSSTKIRIRDKSQMQINVVDCAREIELEA